MRNSTPFFPGKTTADIAESVADGDDDDEKGNFEEGVFLNRAFPKMPRRTRIERGEWVKGQVRSSSGDRLIFFTSRVTTGVVKRTESK